MQLKTNNTEQTSRANPCPFGTFGMVPADPGWQMRGKGENGLPVSQSLGARAGTVPKASRDNSLGTFGKHKGPMRIRIANFLIVPFLIGTCSFAEMTQPEASKIMSDIVFALQTDGIYRSTSRSFDAVSNAKEIARVNRLFGPDFDRGSTTTYLRDFKQANHTVYLYSIHLKKTRFTYLARLDVHGDRAIRFSFD